MSFRLRLHRQQDFLDPVFVPERVGQEHGGERQDGRGSSATKVIERNNCLKMEPVFFKRGRGLYRVLSFHEDDMRNMFSQLEAMGTVKVLSRRSLNGSPVKDTFVISATGLLGSLTKKQSLALRTALSRRCYDIPKRVSTDEIAKGLCLPRTTFEEHLRKAGAGPCPRRPSSRHRLPEGGQRPPYSRRESGAASHPRPERLGHVPD